MSHNQECSCVVTYRLELALERGLELKEKVITIQHERRCKSYSGKCCNCDPVILVCYEDEVLSIQDDGSFVPVHNGEEMVRN